MRLYMLGKGVAKYYRNNVKGNYCADINLIQKKLTRNIMLGKEYTLSNREKLFIYGNLLIFTNKNKITKLYNIKGKGIIKYNVNVEKYNELNKSLKINNDKYNNKGVVAKSDSKWWQIGRWKPQEQLNYTVS